MFKTEILLILFASLFGSSLGRPKKREIVTTTQPSRTWKYSSNNGTNTPTDVRLQDVSLLYSESEDDIEIITRKSNHTGLIEVLLPRSSEPLFMCYPENSKDYRQAYIFAHVTCRQMGFMTFSTMNGKKIPPTMDGKRYHGFKPSRYSCTGQEQNVSHCNWNNVDISDCQMYTEISCGACYKRINDFSGIIKSPGFPTAYLFDTTCEWDIIVPEEHSILLSFHQLDAPFPAFSKPCPLHKPYVEITYGNLDKMNIRRYCSLKEMKNMSVPFHEVKIRIFTGIYLHTELHALEKEKGVAFTFEAIPVEISSQWFWKFIFLIVSVLIFLVTVISCHYCHKYRLFSVKVRPNCELPIVNPLAVEDPDREYAFERCKIQKKENCGLRLRSNGSGPKLSRIFFPSNSGSTYDGNRKNPVQVETPKTIPEIILDGTNTEESKQSQIWRAKVNLLDRYSNNCSNGNISSKLSTSSPVFFTAVPNFQIYVSESSELNEETKKKPRPPPHETAL